MDETRREMRLLLLGGTGNVGKHVLQALVDRAELSTKVFVSTRRPEAFCREEWCLKASKAVVEPVQCNLSCPKSVASTVTSVAPNLVFLCLPQSLAPKDMEAVSNAAVDAAIKSGAHRLVRIASLGIAGHDDGPGQGALGDAHVSSEEYCHAAGLPLTSVRPTSFHTNFLNYDAETICKENCFRSPLGTSARVNWVHCKDIGRVAAVLLLREETPTRGNEVFEVTGPPESTLSAPAMASLLSEELGRQIHYEQVAPPQVAEYSQLWRFLQAGGFDCSTGVVEELTGEPPVDFRSFVREKKRLLGC